MNPPRLDPNRRKIFVNRDGPLEIFDEAVRAIPADGAILRVFHAMGGQGKSALCEYIRDRRAKNHQHLKCAYINLAPPSDVVDGIKLLVKLRNGMAGAGVSTGAFDFALAVVWEAIREEDTYPVLVKPLIARSRDVFGDVASDGVQLGRELTSELGEELKTWPGVGTAIRLISNYGIKRAQDFWLFKSRKHMQALLTVDKELKPGDQLTEMLPWLLAQDLNRHLERNSQHRFALLIDEYESLLNDNVTSRPAKDGNFDAMLQRFIAETDGLLVVFFLRGALPWENDPGWSDALENNQHDIKGLEDEFAANWLAQEGIRDTAIQQAMIASGRETDDPQSLVCPLFLELQVEHWRSLQAAKRDFDAETFRIDATDVDTRRQQLVDRLLRDAGYGKPLQKTLERLAVIDRFDRQAFEHVIRQCGTGLSMDAFEDLCKLSISRKSDDGFVSLHRAVNEALAAGLSDERRDSSIVALLEHFTGRASVETGLDVTDKTVSALFLAARLRREQGAQGYVDWLSNPSRHIEQSARYATALSLWQTALGFCREHLGENHEDTATCYNNVAFTLDTQGRFEEAEPLYKKALEIKQKTLSEEHTSTATGYNNFASNLAAQGRFEEAEPLFKKGLEINKKSLGEEHPSTTSSYNNVAYNLNAQGRFEEAEPLYKKALEIRQKTLGEEHPDTATSYNNVASNLDDQGRFEEAEPLYKKALEIKQKTLGEDHPSTATSYNNVAFNLNAQGRSEEAEPLYRKAVEVFEKALGPDHPNTIAGKRNLEIFLARRGDGGD